MRTGFVRAAVAVAVGAGVAAFTAAASVAGLHAQSGWQVIASGLSNPRGLNFAPNGSLYVAEAGSGGNGACVTSGDGQRVCYGTTGAITKITNPSTNPVQQRIVTGLPSLAPEGGSGATGPHDIDFQGAGNGWVTIGFGGNPANRSQLGAAGAQFGRLVRIQPNGKVRYEADLAAYEAAANPDQQAPDSNAYGVLAAPGNVVYADAGGNAVNQVAANGKISTLAVFPNRIVQNPFAPPGVTVPMQAVPTTVVRGPDGAYYVGQLTGFPFPVGGARVYRVPADGGTPQVYADGFTNIIDIAFGPDGSLYVLEIFANGLLSNDPQGALIRVAPDGTKTTVASAGLITPGGVAIGPDGAIYVTNQSVSATTGEVVRISQ